MREAKSKIEIESTYFHKYETIAVSFSVHPDVKLTNEQKLMLINRIHAVSQQELAKFTKEIQDGRT